MQKPQSIVANTSVSVYSNNRKIYILVGLESCSSWYQPEHQKRCRVRRALTFISQNIQTRLPTFIKSFFCATFCAYSEDQLFLGWFCIQYYRLLFPI